MRRTRGWLIAGAVVLVVVAAVLIALPPIARHLVVVRLAAMSGHAVTLERLNLNLFTRRLAFVNLRIDGGDGLPALVAIGRIDARFRLLPLLRGRLHLDDGRIASPSVEIVRARSGDTNADTLVSSFKGPGSSRTIGIAIERFVLTNGAFLLHDHAVEPVRTWEARRAEMELAQVGTGPDAPPGRGSIRLTVAGAPVDVALTNLGLGPLRGDATIGMTGFHIAQVSVYLGDAAVRPGGGVLNARMHLTYANATGVRSDGDVTMQNVAMIRHGETAPFVTAPELTLTSRGLVYANGVVTAGHLEMNAAPTVIDPSVDPPQRFDLSSLRATFDGIAYPSSVPGRFAVTAELADGGRLEATGRLQPRPFTVAGDVAVRDANVGLVSPYIPSSSPVTVRGGRFEATATLAYGDEQGLRGNVDFRVPGLVLGRRDQREPFVTHSELKGTIGDLALNGGQMTVDRFTLTGAPTITDATVSPPQHVSFTTLTLRASGASWPSRGPAQVRVDAKVADGGDATLEGTFDPGTLAADVRATLAGLPLARIAPYLPEDAAIRPAAGIAQAKLRMTRDRAGVMTIGGDGAIADIALAGPGRDAPLVKAPRLAFSVDDGRLAGGAASARRFTLTGSPTFGIGGAEVPVPELNLAVRDLAWPAGKPSDVRLDARLAGSGTLTATGAVTFASRRANLRLRLADAEIAPYRPLLGIQGPIAGRIDGDVAVAGPIDRLTASGTLAGRSVTVGGGEDAPIRVERIEASDVHMEWPSRLDVGTLRVERPLFRIERAPDGSFPLRSTFASPESGRVETASASPGPSPRSSSLADASRSPSERLTFTIKDLALENGDVRFIDHTTTPFYSEEITRLVLMLGSLTNRSSEPASAALTGIVGGTAALELHGEVAPFADPLFLDLRGQLSDFSIPRTNPYLQRLLNWIARRGQLTTELHYRVVGGELEGSNTIVVRRLDVERARAAGEADRVVGLPIGLAVALLKNPSGDIRLSVPVSGQLASPEFSFGDAIRTALRNVLEKAVTAPLSAIGRVFRKGEKGEEVRIRPVTFKPAEAALSPDGSSQLQRVADFLRVSPYVKVGLEPVVTGRDVQALRSQDVLARIQQAQRDRGTDFATAARLIFARELPDQPMPATPDKIVEALRARAPLPEAEAHELAARRLESARRFLVESAGIPPDRLVAEESPRPGGDGDGRIEFQLKAS